ncbi:MAG TPA: hypothetical protein VEO95_10300, partial [Chthoniobacteraceae bacterium]|nr:hypothetical protein [Chthoniobacteraceae bacterium]
MSEAALVSPRVLACPRCGTGLGGETISDVSDTICPSCRAVFRATLFPIFWREYEAAPQRATLAIEGEASCFFHPENRAAHACDRCGRFICSVCEITVGASRLCPNCLSVGITDPKKAEFIPLRFVWSDAALLMGLVPLVAGIFIWPFLVLTAPTAIFFGVFGWNRPG